MQKGFTLAEVLITLVIIGVIAAMTIPALLAGTKNTELSSAFLKSSSVISSAFRHLMALDGASDVTAYMQEIQGSNTKSGNQSALVADLSRVFSISGIYQPGTYKNESSINCNGSFGYKFLLTSGCDSRLGSMITLVLNDGMILYLDLSKDSSYLANSIGGGNLSKWGDIYVDVNGEKKPNQIGRDVFWYWIDTNGNVKPKGTGQWVINNGAYYVESVGCGDKIGSGPGTPEGWGCAGYLATNGGKMDY
ncbi:MAG: type II secretion system protein [Candidatus Gastranaerophilales bacterium]|nr:type II secretion system protein [Candidatus Gastranaerophilales bacterium]